jgi:hypothetical protein
MREQWIAVVVARSGMVPVRRLPRAPERQTGNTSNKKDNAMRAQDALKEATALRRTLMLTGATSLAGLLAATMALTLASPDNGRPVGPAIATAPITAPAASPVIAAEPVAARAAP